MEPFINIYDIRMNKLLHRVMTQAEPFAVRFHPVLANTLIIVDKQCIVSFADTCSAEGMIPHLRLDSGGYMSSFSMSTTGEAYVMGDMEGHILVHPNSDEFRVCSSASMTQTMLLYLIFYLVFLATV